MDLCQYKDALGEPKKGFHAARIAGFAAWDVIGTAAIALLLARGLDVAWFIMFIILIIVGIVLHKLFCVPTTLNVFLGLAE